MRGCPALCTRVAPCAPLRVVALRASLYLAECVCLCEAHVHACVFVLLRICGSL